MQGLYGGNYPPETSSDVMLPFSETFLETQKERYEDFFALQRGGAKWSLSGAGYHMFARKLAGTLDQAVP